FEHFLSRIGHILRHRLLVGTELVIELQNRDAPAVLYVRVDLDIVLIARQHFAKSAHVDEGAGLVANFLLPGRAEARRRHSVTGYHGAAAAALETISADEFWIFRFQIAEARHIKSAGMAVVERPGLSDKIFH